MARLKESLPAIADEFAKGNFVVQKTNRLFSRMAIDQAHEQNNAAIKGDGGAVGLLQSPDSLRRWMIAGPEVARLLAEFEAAMDARATANGKATQHHKQNAGFQNRFASDVRSLVNVMEDMGNPFLEEGDDLLKLDTGDIVDHSVVNSLQQAEQTGQEQYDSFVKERLVDRTTPLNEPIKKNKLSLFCRRLKSTSKNKLHVSSLKSDCSLFARMYISCQTRAGDLAISSDRRE